jgi:uncharacterized protein
MSTSTLQSVPIAKSVRQKIQIPYSYVAGPAVTKFLLGLKERLIYASVCSACGRRSVPPLSFCGRCWRPITEFAVVGPRGIVESFAMVPARQSTAPADAPLIYALIRLDGADSLLAHVIAGAGVRIGAAVEPQWAEQRQGSILDIVRFRIVG